MNVTKWDEMAFPLVESTSDGNNVATGLTKLEYFSAMAMQGILARHSDPGAGYVAKVAVEMAKALIDELNKQQHNG